MQQSWNSSFSFTFCWWIRAHLASVTTRVSPYLHKEDPGSILFECQGRLKLGRSTGQSPINLQRSGRSKGSSGFCKTTPKTGRAAADVVTSSVQGGRSPLSSLRKFCININSFVVAEFETIIPTNRPIGSRNRPNVNFSVCGLPGV